MLHFVVNIGIMIYGSYLMRNFKKLYHFTFNGNNSFISCRCRYNRFAATDEHTYKNFKYRILDDNTAEICGYTGKNAVVTVPDSIDSKPVTSIGRTAFYSGKIKEVTIPNTVRSINGGLFTVVKALKNQPEFWFKNCRLRCVYEL